jgi:RNase P/RNase MRP subunit POP5
MAKWFGFQPDEKQLAVLESKSSRGILNCSRQWGKSTVAAVKALHRAYSVPESLVLVASPSGRQSGEFIEKTTKIMRRAGLPIRGDGFNDCL